MDVSPNVRPGCAGRARDPARARRARRSPPAPRASMTSTRRSRPSLQQRQCVARDLLEIALPRRPRSPYPPVWIQLMRRLRRLAQRLKGGLVAEVAPARRIGRDRRQQPVQIQVDRHVPPGPARGRNVLPADWCHGRPGMESPATLAAGWGEMGLAAAPRHRASTTTSIRRCSGANLGLSGSGWVLPRPTAVSCVGWMPTALIR